MDSNEEIDLSLRMTQRIAGWVLAVIVATAVLAWWTTTYRSDAVLVQAVLLGIVLDAIWLSRRAFTEMPRAVETYRNPSLHGLRHRALMILVTDVIALTVATITATRLIVSIFVAR